MRNGLRGPPYCVCFNISALEVAQCFLGENAEKCDQSFKLQLIAINEKKKLFIEYYIKDNLVTKMQYFAAPEHLYYINTIFFSFNITRWRWCINIDIKDTNVKFRFTKLF